MPQDAFNLRRNAEELDGLLSGGKINKVVQPARDEVLLYIYTGKSLLKLTICTNASFCRVCLTEEEKDAPAVAPNFCMLLRKHLLGAQITKVEQVGFERIVAVTMHCVSDFAQTDRVLYCGTAPPFPARCRPCSLPTTPQRFFATAWRASPIPLPRRSWRNTP